MPELPEVETVRAYLERVTQHQIVSVQLQRTDLRYPFDGDAVRALQGGEIVAVRRRAKYLLIDVHHPQLGHRVLLIHLGMSGRFFLDLDLQQDGPWLKHEHARFGVQAGSVVGHLRFVDPRRFGAIDVMANTEESDHKLLKTLDPELESTVVSEASKKSYKEKSC